MSTRPTFIAFMTWVCILIAGSRSASASTVLYLHNGSADATPSSWNGSWDCTTGSESGCADAPVTKKMGTDKSGASASPTVAETSSNTAWDVALGRFVSEAMEAQTLSGTVNWVMKIKESNAAANMFWHINIYVMTTAGAVHCVLLDDVVETSSEFSSTAQGQGSEAGARTITDCVVTSGQRIVAEVGYRSTEASATSRNAELSYGGTSSTALTVGDTNGAHPGGFTFSTDILWSRYWVGRTGNWSTAGEWSQTSGGSTSAGVPDATCNVYFDANSFNASSQVVTIDTTATFNAMTWSGVTNTPTLAGSFSMNANTAVTLTSGMNVTYTGTLSNYGSTDVTFTSAGKTWTGEVAPGGNMTFSTADALTTSKSISMTGSTLAAPVLSLGGNLTLSGDSSNNTLTVSGSQASFYSNSYDISVGGITTTTTSPTFSLGTSKVNLSGTWDAKKCPAMYFFGILEPYTLYFDNATGTTTTPYAHNNRGTTSGSYNNIMIGAGVHYLFTNDVGSSYRSIGIPSGTGLTLTAGVTSTITDNLVGGGNSSTTAYLRSQTSGATTTISKASGTVQLRYMSLRDITATGGATFKCTCCTNTSNNSGITFEACPTTTSGNVYLDSATHADTGGNYVEVLRWPHTVTGFNNRILVVGIASTGDTISSVKWGSTSLTAAGSITGTTAKTDVYYMVAPATGTDLIEVTYVGGLFRRMAAGAWSFANVNQSTPFGTVATASGSSASPSVTISSAVGELPLAVLAAYTDTATITSTAGTSETQSWSDQSTATSFDVRASGLFDVTGASSVTINPSLSASTTWSIAGLSLKPAVATAVRMASTKASRVDGGNLLEWRTGHEIGSVGFHVYRHPSGGERVRVTPALVVASALLAGEGREMTSGHSYSFFDAGGSPSDRYTVEELGMDGKVTAFEPVAVGAADAQTIALRNRAVGNEVTGRAVALPGAPHTTRGGPATARRSTPLSGALTDAAQSRLAQSAATKLTVRGDGVFSVSSLELAAFGLDGEELSLWWQGKEFPLSRDSEGIVFYLPPMADVSATRTLWLDASSASTSIGVEPASDDALPAAVGYMHREDELAHRAPNAWTYVAALGNGEASNWFGPAITHASPTVITLPVTDRVRSKLNSVGDAAVVIPAAKLDVKLQGGTNSQHRARVSVNGEEVGAVVFAGHDKGSLSVDIEPGLLRDGDNEITVVSATDEDTSLVESVSLTYFRRHVAAGDRLHATIEEGNRARLSGFSSDAVRVFDVTDEVPTELMVSLEPEADGEGYGAWVNAEGSAREVVAFAKGRSVASLVRNEPSALRDVDNVADLMVVSHGSLIPALAPLVKVREAQGLVVKIVDVADVYDEFSFGEKRIGALKEFLQYAHTRWGKGTNGAKVERAPRFVLLVGDASYDEHNVGEGEERDLVPTGTLHTEAMETASDDWLVDFNGDDRPDMALGRLPAGTLKEAQDMVGKILAHQPRLSSVLLVADKSETERFEAGMSYMKDSIASGTQVSLTRADQGWSDRLKQGPSVVHYAGHGATDVLSTAPFSLTSEQAKALVSPPSIFLQMTCLNGRFHDLVNESMAEALMRAPKGGAVAVWASSGMTSPEPQSRLAAKFYAEVDGGAETIGEAIMNAKATFDEPDVLRTWILFGDPSMPIQRAEPPPPLPNGCTCTLASTSRWGLSWGPAIAGIILAARRRRRSSRAA